MLMSRKNRTTTTAMSAAALNGLLRKHGVSTTQAGKLLEYEPAAWNRRLKNGVADAGEAQTLRERIPQLAADTPATAEPNIKTAAEANGEQATEPTKGKATGRAKRKARQPTEKAERPAPPANRVNSATWRRTGGLDHTQLERSMSLAGYTVQQGIDFLRGRGDSVNKKLVALRFSTPDMVGEEGKVHGWELSQVEKYGTFGGPERSRALDWSDVPAELRKEIVAAVGKPKGEPRTRPAQSQAA